MYPLLFELPDDLFHQRFLQTDFGKLFLAIPFKELSALVPPAQKIQSGKGRKSRLSVESGRALLVAKHYLQVSDSMLIEKLNTDWSLQMFCGIRLRPDEKIKDDDLPDRWHSYLGKYQDIDKWQQCHR